MINPVKVIRKIKKIENLAGYQDLIKKTEGRISAEKARNATLCICSETSTINTGENRKNSKSEDLKRSYSYKNLKIFIYFS